MKKKLFYGLLIIIAITIPVVFASIELEDSSGYWSSGSTGSTHGKILSAAIDQLLLDYKDVNSPMYQNQDLKNLWDEINNNPVYKNKMIDAQAYADGLEDGNMNWLDYIECVLHLWDPDDQSGLFGSKYNIIWGRTPGAPQFCSSRFNWALIHYLGLGNFQVDKEQAYHYLGWAIHMLQDVTCPVHAANTLRESRVLGKQPNHTVVEDRLGVCWNSYESDILSAVSVDYSSKEDWFGRTNVMGWVHQASWAGKNNWHGVVKDNSLSAKKDCLTKAVEFTAGFMFYFWQYAHRDPSDPMFADYDGDGLDIYEEENHGTDFLMADTDADGMTDGWEVENNFNPTNANDANADADNDDLDNIDEFYYNSNPRNSDSDQDGWSDGFEIHTSMTSPIAEDTDNDEVMDSEEFNYWKTRNLDDATAYLYCAKWDTDEDLINDGYEINGFYRSANPGADEDGRITGCDPLYSDTDSDGLEDGEEVFDTNTDPTDSDTDNDHLSDGWEIGHIDPRTGVSFNPNDVSDGWFDHDADGLPTNDEVTFWGTHWNNDDTDGDGYLDGEEIMDYLTDPIDDSDNPTLDHDNDGISTYDEVNLYNTDPYNDDTDGDGWTDYQELFPVHGDPSDPIDPTSTPAGGGGFIP